MTLQKHKSRGDTRYLAVSLLALLATSSGFAQATSPAATPAATPEVEDDVVVLSPFEVVSSNDKGYYAENTLAGSRLNTKISDLAASISVITKQLMEDTGSVDVNDIFRYEINTEGSLTYTPAVQSMRSDGIADVNSGFASGGLVQNGTNATANRVRGLGSPTAAINYYPSISSVPMDSYNLTSVEINRGPNSMLFGMGSPAGIVNQTLQGAMLSRDTNTVTARVDSNGSYRSTFAFNRALIKDKLAIYGAAAIDNRRFARKPSYDNTKRYYGAITFKPFESTTIKANMEFYTNNNRRPNSLTPRDYVTQWNLAGQPIYDSVNRTITRTSDGRVLGIYVPSSSSPNAASVRNFITSLPTYNASLWGTGGAATGTTYNGVSIFGDTAMTNTASAMYAPGIAYVNKGRSIQQIVDGQLTNWFMPLLEQTYKTGWGSATAPDGTSHTAPIDNFITSGTGNTAGPSTTALWANPTWAAMYNRGFTGSAAWNGPTAVVGGYKYPGLTDKAIYDYTEINLNEMNFGKDQNKTFNVELEQKILDNLFFNAGWFRQNYRSMANYTVAQLNVATLFVDTNKYLPDGTLNPMVGKVYVEDQDADYTLSKQDNDNYRAMLAYTPDFTKHKGWSKWLGKHQILGLWSRTESMGSTIRRRLLNVDSDTPAGRARWLPNENNKLDGSATGWNFGSNGIRRMFYLEGANDPDGTVTQASGEWNLRSLNSYVTVYDYATSGPQMANVTQTYIDHDASTGRNQRLLDSWSAGVTNYLWANRLVTTFGVRRDENRTRGTTNGAILTGLRGTQLEPAMTNPERWVNGVYQTDRVLDRWNYWTKVSGTTNTMGGVLKPFLGWKGIEQKANGGSQFWQFVRDFGFSYNESDNFDAPAITYVDGFGNPLPKSTGDGKDYGFQFSLFDNRFYARMVWFEGTNVNERTNPGSSIARLTGNMDTVLFRNWARTIAMINMGMDPRVSGFGSNLSATQEAAIQAAVDPIWQMPYNYYNDLGATIYATRTAEAKGVELQLNYNPVPSWTMRLTAGKQTTIYSDVLREFDAWYNERAPIWKSAQAATYLLPQYQSLATYTTPSGRAVDLTSFWSSFGYRDEIKGLDEVNGYFNPELYYNGVVAPQIAQNRDLDGQAAPGQRRYRWSYMTNYGFSTGWLKGVSVGGSQRWEDKAVIGYLGKSSGLNTNPAYMDMSDVTKPIYDSANWYTDIWCSYSRKIFKNKVNMKVQLNVDNVFEDGGLRLTAVNYDGSPYAFRIVDSRLYKLTTTFDF